MFTSTTILQKLFVEIPYLFNRLFFLFLQKEKWQSENHLSAGALWIELIRFYTEQFNYDEHVVTIRKKEPLLKYEKGWFRQTIAIEDPFELSHNLAGGLPPRSISNEKCSFLFQ